MTVVMCGRTHQGDRAEAIVRSLREQQGFCLDVGCGRSFDLDNAIQNIRVYRCLECARWLCKPCIVAHFEETSDAYTTAAAPRTARPDSRPLRPTTTEEEDSHRTVTDRAIGCAGAIVPRTVFERQGVRRPRPQRPAI